MILIFLFIFLVGLVIGSFLNVVIFRYNTGAAIMNDRSGCLSCGKKLVWYELIPVLSFMIQKGRCRKCGSKISWQYPLVEIMTGLLYVALFLKIKPTTVPELIFFVYTALIWSILMVIIVYDIRHKIIPDGLVYTFILLSLAQLIAVQVFHIFEYPYYIVPFINNFAAGIILFLPFFSFWFFSKGRWMGFGDAKLAIGIGWYMGIIHGLSSIVLGFWIGAVCAIIILVMGKLSLFRPLKQLTIKSEIPFAPFLIVGMFIAFFFGLDVLGLSLFL